MLARLIPSTKEPLPVIGLGTWQVFDVPQQDTTALVSVLDAMTTKGAKLIDSSPMYGRAEETVGLVSQQTADPNQFFYATKVWTTGKIEGIHQIKTSMRRMQRATIDLIQIHNLTDWQTQLQTLQEWKAAGKIRYIGITHYLDEMHEELEKIISTVPVDFVQFNYSITDRNAEKRLLPVAIDHGVATLINRPLNVGKLFSKVSHMKLPEWCKEYHINSWSQYFLKYLTAHPGVTCIIPATGNPQHMEDNLLAGHDIITDKKVLDKMVQFITSL